jgi:tetratricopeptide (TPR) repeat protein
MQYHCVQCNELFTLDPSDDKPRCPKCLRQHGLRPVEAAKPSRETRRWLGPVAALVLLAGAGGGYALYRQSHKHAPGQAPLEPISADDVRTDVRALAGVDAGDYAQLLEADSKLAAFAEHAAQGQTTADGKAKAICAALQDRQRKQAFVAWPRVDPREGLPLTASGTWAAIARDGARRQLYPLELGALAVAALRSVGVPALLAEVYRYPNERTALDPSGRLGYFAAFVPADKGPGGHVYDAYGGRTEQPKAADFVVLNDVQAVGAAFALRGMHKLDNMADTKNGLADAEIAVKLLPSSASTRSVRAALLLATGGVEAGTRELDAAAQLRNDAPRHNNMAVLALVGGDPNGAAKEVSLALAELPDYALAHVTLASVDLMRNERDQARVEIEQAERLEPDLPVLSQVWAQYYASSNDFERAIAKAEEAVQRKPKDPQGRLLLARIFRAAGRYDDMRKQARAVMQQTSADEKERIKSVLNAVLGPTALEDDSAAEPSSDSAGQRPQASDTLTLSQPAASPDGKAGPPGDLQLHPDTSKLHLGSSGSRLKLDLKP